MAYMCDSPKCKRLMTAPFCDMVVNIPHGVLGVARPQTFVFCSRCCFVTFCLNVRFVSPPMAINTITGVKSYTSIPSRIVWPREEVAE